MLLRSNNLSWNHYEAKQWAIGDWLVDGKRHYGDGLYEKAFSLTGIEIRSLQELKQIASRFKITERSVNLSWSHHKEVASIKKTHRSDAGKWKISDEPDTDKMQENSWQSWRGERARGVVKHLTRC